MVNTDAYLLLGVTMVMTVLSVYALGLWLRFRQTARMIQTMEALKEDQ
jgi:hypothetical protein